jgi:hypothetical protein
MEYGRKKGFEGLRQVIEYLGDKPLLGNYKEYCEYRSQGRRQEAFRALNRFLAQASDWEFNDKKEFVDWILWVHFGLPDGSDLLPDPLYRNLIEPTLSEWREKEPGSGASFRWSGGVENLRKALEIDRHDEIAQMKFAKAILNHTNYSIHELPTAYLGEPHEDLSDLEEAMGYFPQPLRDAAAEAIWSDLNANYATVKNWILQIGEPEA